MAIYSIKRFSVFSSLFGSSSNKSSSSNINKAKELGYTIDTVRNGLPKLYWELKKVSDKMKSHPFNKVMNELDDAGFPYLDIYGPEEILDDLLTYQKDTKCPIINVSNNVYSFDYDFEENGWIYFNPRARKEEITDDKTIKSEILNFWREDIEDWKDLCKDNPDMFSSKKTENLFFDYVNKLYKEVERIRV